MASEMPLREVILAEAHDSGLGFVVYDRKEDEELSQDQLLGALADGLVTVDEIAAAFADAIRAAM